MLKLLFPRPTYHLWDPSVAASKMKAGVGRKEEGEAVLLSYSKAPKAPKAPKASKAPLAAKAGEHFSLFFFKKIKAEP